MEFRCRIGKASGEVVEGVYVAEDASHLRREFERKGLLVLSVHRRGHFAWPALTRRRGRRVRQRELIVFNQELATLLNAGMPVVQSLDILRQRAENPTLKSMLDDVCERVRSGEALSEAFEAQSPPLPRVYTASLVAGERSGNLQEVIRRYVTHARILNSVRRKTLSAMIYPVILFGLSLLVMGIIVYRVVPQFADFYGGLGTELPLITRAIMGFSESLRSYGVLMTAALAALAAGVWGLTRSAGRGEIVDRVLLHIPGIGGIIRKFQTSQLARTLATLLGGGMPLVSALDVAGRSIGNRHFAGQLELVAHEVREGQPLSRSMSRRTLFPAVAVKMVEVGESTGALQQMLNGIADFFDEDIETTLGRLMTLLEPVLLVVIGIVIAGMLLALYMPLLQLGTLV